MKRKQTAIKSTLWKNFVFLNALGLLCSYPINSTYAAESYDKYWSVAIISGSLSEYSSFKYYLEPQIRLIDNPYVFNQFLLLGGLGYQFNSNLALYLGPGWVTTKDREGTLIHERRLWQQLFWLMWDSPAMSLNSRTRLEERDWTNSRQVNFRLRQRFWARIPFKNWEKFAFSCFNEVFFNVNHPVWTSPKFFEQNRAFFGIAKEFSRSAILDVGYLNQYLNAQQKYVDHVALLSLTVNF